MLNNFDKFETIINYQFVNKDLLLLSLTHASYANENNIKKTNTNQRLEFLGDAVLELISSDFLYSLYEDYNEGDLTKIRAKLVCEENLACIARDLRIYDYLLIGKGESKNSIMNNNSTMCDSIEALIGAIYMDGGINQAKKFIDKFILTDANLNKSNNDYKSVLQEIANKNSIELKYEILSEMGPDHDKRFEVAAYYGGRIIGSGIGKSKKEAEQLAAKNGLKNVWGIDVFKTNWNSWF